MSSTATNATLAGLGFSDDTISVDPAHSSGDESFDSLFSQISLPSTHDSDVGEPPAEVEGHWHVTYDPESEPEVNDFEPYLGIPEVSDLIPWPTR